jgi:hypothetical protein
MAEIHLQRKKPSIWPSLLAALAMVLLVWLVAETWVGDDDERLDEAVSVPAAPEIAATSGTSPAPPADVAAFMTFAANSEAPATGPAHDYTAAGIRRLSAALDAMTREKRIDGENVRERLQAFRRMAEQIQSNPEAAAHANQVREVFMSAANLMSAMQQDRWSDAADIRSAVENVRTAAGAIAADRPLLEQASDVRRFFDRAATALREMVQQT